MVSTLRYQPGEDVGARVREVIANVLQVELKVLTPGARFGEEIDSDSLDLVELVVELEQVFDIAINDDDIDGLRTVQDTIRYVEGRLPH
jgi:acyl carrier protein